jgi:hypothetical protein
LRSAGGFHQQLQHTASGNYDIARDSNISPMNDDFR